MNISVKELTKRYREKEVFDRASFFIESGKTTAIMGKSGIGKTTLIKILMGLEKYDSGNIEGLKGKKVAAVFQEDRLCENLSPVTNVLIVCEKRITAERIRCELAEIGLGDSADKPVRELSGGMKRRVAIVRSIMAESDILVLDEPFKGLDQETKNRVIDYLKKRIEGKTVILVTHDIGEAKIFNSNIIDIKEENK